MSPTHLLFFFFDGKAQTTAGSAAGTSYGTSQPPIGFWAFNDGATPSDVEPEPPVQSQPDTGAGSGKWPNEDELWEYIEALKASFRQEAEHVKEELAERLEEEKLRTGEVHADVEIVDTPIDALYADLDEVLASTASLQARWNEVERIEREFKEMQEEEAVVRLLFEFITED